MLIVLEIFSNIVKQRSNTVTQIKIILTILLSIFFNELRVCFYEIRQKITLVLNDKKMLR